MDEAMLSTAETLVLDHLKLGLCNKEIGERLFVCEKTVKFHLTNIYKKLNVKSRSELIAKTLGQNIYIEENEGEEVADETLPNNQGYRAVQVVKKSQEDKILFIDKNFKVGETIDHLHSMMKDVTKSELTPNTVNAACNCVARLNETINTAIQAARFLNER